jgi:probable HAF family extracellular repeat protein
MRFCPVAMLLLMSVGLGVSAIAAPRYSVSDLGPLPHIADEVSLKINSSGQVAGWADSGGGVIHACLWTNGRPQDLGTLLGFQSSIARGLNSRGQAVGWSVSGKNLGDSLAVTHACLFSAGKCVDLGTLGGRTSQAFAINFGGRIVGVSQVSPSVRHAFLYRNGKMIDLGTLPGGTFSLAYDINDAGQIAGISETITHAVHAFLWQRGHMADLGALPGGQVSLAYALNSLGQAAGSAVTGGQYHAVRLLGGKISDLGTLGTDPAVALGINDDEQIVGASNVTMTRRHAFLWENGHLLDLNTLIISSLGWTLLSAESINRTGQIACVARTKSSGRHAVVLTPLPTKP